MQKVRFLQSDDSSKHPRNLAIRIRIKVIVGDLAVNFLLPSRATERRGA